MIAETRDTSVSLASISTRGIGRCYSTELSAGEGPLGTYRRLSKLGQLTSGDLPQERVAAALDKLSKDLLLTREPRCLRERLFCFFWQNTMKKNLRGIYIHGEVGRGKTMLMDLFYDEVNLSKKRRVHFHAFMLDVHRRLHMLVSDHKKTSVDCIKSVAEQLVEEARLLCLDEVEVTDIADALILRRLFAVLWPLGILLVATSNSAPEQLYHGGLNRLLFEPFIDQLKEHCNVYCVDEGRSLDYRRGLSTLDQLFLYPLTDGNDGLLDEAFMTLTGGLSSSMVQVSVMMGRNLQILAAKGVARASFQLLCGGPYGAADYLAIARNFMALILDRIPCLGDPALENEARRFITLIDVLYEANTVLVCSAAVSIDNLFKQTGGLDDQSLEASQQVRKEAGIHITGQGGSSGRSTLMIGEMEWSATGRKGVSLADFSGASSFTRAASARTVSRLVEMQSRSYLLRAGTVGGIILSNLDSAD